MERPMVDPAVLRRFSAGASRYEAHAHAQRLSAIDLLAYTQASLGPDLNRGIVDTSGEPAPKRGPAFKILEPGCGTGLYTRMLLDAFPAASILGVDISEAMIRVARKGIDDQGWSSAATGRDAPGLVVAAEEPRVRFAVADAEEIVTGNFDLVTSNAAFQWFLSLPRTLARMASLLPGGGLLTFSFFGPETFAELDAALRASANRREPEEGERIAAVAFHSREEISDALSAVFPRWDVAERRYHQEYPTLADLLRSIRYTGTRGGGARESWSPGKLARVEEAYRKRDGGIKTTYQVFLCRGMIDDGQGRPSVGAGRDAPDFEAPTGQGRPSAATGRDARDIVVAAGRTG
jgi:malonyl-CoA O-methyltransferase